MKKRGGFLATALMALLLAACNNTAEPQSGSENNSDATLDEVYQKAIDRQNELESVTATVKMDQLMSFGTGEESFEIPSKSDLTMDMITKPLAMHMEGTMGMAEPGTDEETSIKMEMYMSEEGMYVQDSMSNQWSKLPTDDFEAVIGQAANQVNASKQLEDMKAFIEDFKFEQTDESYILSLDASSEKFNEYMLEQLQVNEMLNVSEEEQTVLKNTKFEKVNYVIEIDKETYDITKMDSVVDLTMKMEDQTMSIDSNTAIVFSNYNGVEDISIPQEVIDGAIEIEY